MIESLVILKTVISAISTAGSVSKWLNEDSREPLKRAFDRTVTKFETEFPAVKDDLLRLLDIPNFPTLLEPLALEDKPNLERVSVEFIRITGFYLPDQVEQQAAIARIFAFFLESFDREQLIGAQGLLWHDEKQSIRHAQVLTAISTANQTNELRAQIQEMREATKGKSFKDARDLWRLEEHAVARTGSSDSTLLFELNSGTCQRV